MILNDYADIVIGLQYGDEGKGKISAAIAEQIDNYDIVARYNGGPNAGHSVHIENNPNILKLHQIPSGAAFKKNSHIGAGCVIDIDKLYQEANEFNSVMGFHPFAYLTIDPKAIVIDPIHVKEDRNLHAAKQGSTSSGIAPAYGDFYNRTSKLAEDLEVTYYKKNLVQSLNTINTLLLEGAQGWYLNPYQGNYPFTTSSSCHPGSAASTFGFPVSKIRNIIGVAKCYETRSGIDDNFNKVLNANENYIDPIPVDFDLNQIYQVITEAGNEYGVTTGRKRAVRFLDLNRLIKSINESGTNILILQKWDILQQVDFTIANSFSFYYEAKLVTSMGLHPMIEKVLSILKSECSQLEQIHIEADPICRINWKEVFND